MKSLMNAITEEEQIKYIDRYPWGIKSIIKPSETVQLTAINSMVLFSKMYHADLICNLNGIKHNIISPKAKEKLNNYLNMYKACE